MIEAKVSHEELILYEILRNPVLCTEFIRNYDKVEGLDTPFELTWYQKEMVSNFNSFVSFCTARAIGKCLSKDSMIVDTNTGKYRTVEEWFVLGEEISIPSIDFNTLKREAELPIILDNGIKTVLEISLNKGFKTKVTEEHPFLTPSGWKEAKNLSIGEYIAIPSSLPYFGSDTELSDEEICYLAHFIAEGSYNTGGITTVEPEVIEDLYAFADKYNMSIYTDKLTYHFKGTYRLDLLEKVGLRYTHSYEKFIPQEIFSLPKKKLSLFLNRLFGDDGWCYINGSNYEIGYASSSEKLARDIQHLLLRYGIISSLGEKKTSRKPAWSISIKGIQNINRFYEIGFKVKRKQEALDKIYKLSKSVSDTTDIIPTPNYKKYHIKKNGWNRNLSYYPTREKTEKIIDKDQELNRLLSEDVFWLKIKSISNLGLEQTYSIECPENHTLVADNIYSHNTESLISIMTWLLIFDVFPEEYVCYIVPAENNLKPVWNGLVRDFRTNSFLSNFLGKKTGINGSDHTIMLTTGATLMCRIAGQSGTGISVIGLHTPFSIVDESGYFPWGTWLELQPTINTFTPGFRLVVAGVPDGRREKSVCYHCDQENSAYSRHRISSLQNPRFTQEDFEKALKDYGGEDSQDTLHFIYGKHGSQVFSIFDRSLMALEDYPVYRLQIDGIKLGKNLTDYLSKISALPPLGKNHNCVISIDLGYTEPSAINILTLDEYERFRFHAKVELIKVDYQIQERLINALDTKYEPLLLGMDYGAGGQGISVYQHLVNEVEYANKSFNKRLIPIDFSSHIVVGINEEGKEIKSPTKTTAVGVTQEYTNSHKIIYSYTDLDMVSELERMVYVRNPSGELVYRTVTERGGKNGADHFTSSLLCGMLAYYLEKEFIHPRKEKKTLFRVAWNR